MASSKTVLANGCFDPLHYGHVLHLQAAKKLGYLIVSVTRNEHVNKGPGRPVFDELERAGMVTALRCVDAAILSIDALDALKQIKPNIFIKDQEYIGKVGAPVENYCREHGIEIVFTREKRYSSTKLLHHYDLARQR